MNPLSSCTISASRTAVTASLSDTCTIQTVTETNTASGLTKAWADTYTSIACKVTVANYNKQVESIIGGAAESQVWYNVMMAYNQTITTKDRIVTSDSRTLDIIAIPKISDQLFLNVLCKQVG